MTRPPAPFATAATTESGLQYGPSAVDDPAIAGFLTQLVDTQLAQQLDSGGVLLPWHRLHDVLEDDELGATPALIPVPPVDDSIVPELRASGGTIPDRSFRIAITGWHRLGAGAIREKLRFVGPVCVTDGVAPFTLGRHAHRTRSLVIDMARRPEEEYSERDNRLRFVDIRDAALAGGAIMDRMLATTIVLRPRSVRLDLSVQHAGDNLSVTVAPMFDDAPSGWLRAFDRSDRRVRETYSIPGDDGDDIQVVVDDAVREVLQEVRKLPGRRAAGPRARLLLENPMAFFGDAGASVLDVDAIEASLARLRDDLWRLRAHVEITDDRAIAYVDAFLEPIGENATEGPQARRLTTPDGLSALLRRIDEARTAGASAFAWSSRDVALDAGVLRVAEELRTVVDAWVERSAVQPGVPQGDRGGLDDGVADAMLISADLVLDVSRYYDRVTSIGVETPYSIITIPLTEKGAWAPDGAELELLLKLASDGSPSDDERVLTRAELGKFIRDCEEAEVSGASEVRLSDGTAMPTSVARTIIDTLPRSIRAEVTPSHEAAAENSSSKPAPARRIGLQLKSNIDETDFVTAREQRLRPPDEAVAVAPRSLATGIALKRHQKEGLRILQHLFGESPHGCRGALLADDMGLGKTLQILALIAWTREHDPDIAPALVAAPVSLLDNWADEIRRFFGEDILPFQTLYGAGLRTHRASLQEIDPQLRESGLRRFLRPGWHEGAAIVLTTYETLRDYEFSFADVEWSIVACDEAQRIKNPNALMSRAAKKLNARFCVAATGTPVENSLADLWSIFDFVQPGLFEPLNAFSRLYRRPIEARTEDEKERLSHLRRLIEPQMIRRMKKDVLRDLPERIEDRESLDLEMSDRQVELYAAALKGRRIGATAAGNDAAALLNMLALLRRICTDPRTGEELKADHMPLNEYRRISPKLDWLITTLESIRERGEKVLIFLDRKDIQRLVQHYVREMFGFAPEIVNGDTPTSGRTDNRQQRIDRFQSKDGFNVLILSPVAAGVGLNIQGANHVVHYMRHWNPAREDQATDRAYRIGQTRDVHVYTPIVRGRGWASFDERLHELLTSKRGIAEDVLNGVGDVDIAEFSDLLTAAPRM